MVYCILYICIVSPNDRYYDILQNLVSKIERNSAVSQSHQTNIWRGCCFFWPTGKRFESMCFHGAFEFCWEIYFLRRRSSLFFRLLWLIRWFYHTVGQSFLQSLPIALFNLLVFSKLSTVNHVSLITTFILLYVQFLEKYILCSYVLCSSSKISSQSI